MKQMNVRAADKKINTKGTMDRLFRFTKPYRIRIILMMACLVTGAVFTTQGSCALSRAMDVLVAVTVDSAGVLQRFGTFITVLTQLGYVYVLTLLSSYSGQYIVARAAECTMYDLRMVVDRKIRRLPSAYFDSNTFGDVLGCITNDMNTIDASLQQSISRVITTVCTMVFMFVMMLVVSPVLTLIGVCVTPICGPVSMKVVKHSQRCFQGQQSALGNLTGHMEEVYNGQNVTTAFRKRKDVIENFEDISGRLYNNGWRVQFSSSIIMPLTQALTNTGYTGVTVVSRWLCTNGGLNTSMIQSLIQYLRQFSQSISQISSVTNIMQAAMTMTQRILEFLDIEKEVPEAEKP